MNNLSAIRKAAVLVASLDVDSADLLLAQMTDDQADEVRRAVLELGEPNPAEQQAVLDEFFRIGPIAPPNAVQAAELEDHLQSGLRSNIDEYVSPTPPVNPVRATAPQQLLESNSLSRSAFNRKARSDWNGRFSETPDETARTPLQRSYISGSSHAPFSILHDTEPESLVPFLEREHPQAIALVLAHLPPQRAGHILARLPATMQTDVIRRLVDLEETDPHVMRDVELAIEAWFNKQHPTRRRTAGVAAVSAILSAAEGSARRQILNNLTVHDRPLAHKLTPSSKPPRKFTFDEVSRLPLDSLANVVLEADRRTAALALAGTSAELVADLLDHLEPDEADSLSRRLTNLGPMRLADIDRAQDELAELASRLHSEGQLSGLAQSHLTAVV